MRAMRVVLAAWLAAWLVILGGGGGVHASPELKAEDPVIRVDSATTARLCADCSPRVIRFAVTVLTGATLAVAKDAEPTITEVSIGGTRDAAAEALFTGKWEAASDGSPRALLLTVNPSLRTQGTYTVVLNGFPNQRPAAPRITLQIIMPAAKLQAPSKITIERTLGFSQVAVAPPSFTIRETGRVASVNRLSVDPPQLHAGTEPVTGSVGITIDKTEGGDVLADRSATAKIALTGDFPLGVSAGDLRLSAPELADALTIPVEIRSRLAKSFVFVAIVLGMLMSWWLKVFTHNLIERNTARAAAIRLLKRVREDLLKFPDETFHQKIATAFQTLDTARRGSDVKAMDDARTALETAWREAVKELDRTRTDLVQRIATFQELIGRPWALPARLKALLDTAARSITDVVALQQDGNLTKASTDLEAARTTLVKGLREHGGTWQQELRALDDAVLQELKPTFERVHAVLNTAQEAWRARSPLLNAEPPGRTDPANIEPWLGRLHGEHTHAMDTHAMLRDRLEQEMRTAINPATSPNQWAPVRQELDRLASFQADAIEKPADEENNLTASLAQLHKLFTDAQAAARLSQSRGGGDVLLGGAGGQVLGALEPIPLIIGGTPRGSRVSIVTTGAASDGFDAEIVAAETSVWWAKLQQTIIVGVLFVVWALATYSPTFDGTWIGLSTVFFSVFSVDVAVDAMLTKMKR